MRCLILFNKIISIAKFQQFSEVLWIYFNSAIKFFLELIKNFHTSLRNPRQTNFKLHSRIFIKGKKNTQKYFNKFLFLFVETFFSPSINLNFQFYSNSYFNSDWFFSYFFVIVILLYCDKEIIWIQSFWPFLTL